MFYFIAFLVILADQATKFFAVTNLTAHKAVALFPSFNFFLTYNKGVSFSLFSSDNPYNALALSLFALCVCIFICVWMTKEKESSVKLGLALILGGALGNVIDRIRLGSVIDFIDVYYHTYHWPAFNIADSAICLGAFLMILKCFKKKDSK